MVNLQLHKSCPRCRDIAQQIAELVISHQIDWKEKYPPQSNHSPILKDGDIQVKGHAEIEKYLDDLTTFKAEWDKFQSDSCYCDDEGNVE